MRGILNKIKEDGLIILVFGLLVAYVVIMLCMPLVDNSTTIEEKTTVDTVFIQTDTVFVEKATMEVPIQPKKVEEKTTDSPEPEKYDSLRTYSGTYVFDQGKFDWKIKTGGILEGYEFKPTFEIPAVTVTKEKTVTHTKTITQKGLFAGGGMNTAGQFHAGATYLGNKFLVEYNFVPLTVQTGAYAPVHQVGFKYKIF